MLLSLLLPLGAGVITRLALRPRGQGQLTINAPLWALVAGWSFTVLLALLGLVEPMQGKISHAIALILGATVVGLLIPEIFRGLGAATASGLSKPKNWLWLIGVAAVFYGLFVDPSILGGIFLLGTLWLFYRVILGMKPPKKKGG